MIGHKKDRHLISLGQKKDKNLIFFGVKSELNKHNGINHHTSNGLIEAHKTLNQYAPTGLNKLPVKQKLSYLEKR